MKAILRAIIDWAYGPTEYAITDAVEISVPYGDVVVQLPGRTLIERRTLTQEIVHVIHITEHEAERLATMHRDV